MPCNSTIPICEGDWTIKKSEAKALAAYKCIILLLEKGALSKDLMSVEVSS